MELFTKRREYALTSGGLIASREANEAYDSRVRMLPHDGEFTEILV